MEETGLLQSVRPQRIRHNLVTDNKKNLSVYLESFDYYSASLLVVNLSDFLSSWINLARWCKTVTTFVSTLVCRAGSSFRTSLGAYWCWLMVPIMSSGLGGTALEDLCFWLNVAPWCGWRSRNLAVESDQNPVGLLYRKKFSVSPISWHRKQVSSASISFFEFQLMGWNICLSGKAEDEETRQKPSINNTAGLGKGPSSTWRDAIKVSLIICANAETPTKCERLTVCCPQACKP